MRPRRPNSVAEWPMPADDEVVGRTASLAPVVQTENASIFERPAKKIEFLKNVP
jgi:hypothetical protein